MKCTKDLLASLPFKTVTIDITYRQQLGEVDKTLCTNKLQIRFTFRLVLCLHLKNKLPDCAGSSRSFSFT